MEYPTNPEPAPSSLGAVIGSIIIIVLLVAAGIYVWNTKVRPMQEPAGISTATVPASDEVEVIESDLSKVPSDDLGGSFSSALDRVMAE